METWETDVSLRQLKGKPLSSRPPSSAGNSFQKKKTVEKRPGSGTGDVSNKTNFVTTYSDKRNLIHAFVKDEAEKKSEPGKDSSVLRKSESTFLSNLNGSTLCFSSKSDSSISFDKTHIPYSSRLDEKQMYECAVASDHLGVETAKKEEPVFEPGISENEHNKESYRIGTGKTVTRKASTTLLKTTSDFTCKENNGSVTGNIVSADFCRHSKKKIKQKRTHTQGYKKGREIQSPPQTGGPHSAWQIVLDLSEALEDPRLGSCALPSQQSDSWPRLGQRKTHRSEESAEKNTSSLSKPEHVTAESLGKFEIKNISKESKLPVVKKDEVNLEKQNGGIMGFQVCNTEEEIGSDTTSRKAEVEERRKLKKIAKKEKKRREREEEFIKKLHAPKDQKVTVIKKEVIDKILGDKQILPNSASEPVVNFAADFPALGVRQKTMSGPGQQNKFSHFDTIECGPEERAQVPALTQLSSTKKCKRRDPVTIDILEAMKASAVKHQGKTADIHLSVKKTNDQRKYGGNPLDSSQPERKRGKHRENRPKRLSRLKALVLSERARKRNAILQKQPILLATKHSFQSEMPMSCGTEGKELNTTLSPTIDDGTNDSNNAVNSSLKTKNETCLSFQNFVTPGRNTAVSTIILSPPVESKAFLNCDYEDGTLDANTFGEVINKTEKCESTLKQVPQARFKMDDDLHKNKTSGVFELEDDVVLKESTALLTSDECEAEPVITTRRKELGVDAYKIHSRRFREYCDNSVTAELNEAVTAVLKDIVKFHDAQFLRNAMKANIKRRHVAGLKEVKKYLNLKKLKVVIIAPDVERVQCTGGLDDKIEELKEICSSQGIPCVFALSRKQLSHVLLKKALVSCVGVINYEGTETNFRAMMQALNNARRHYKILTKQPDVEEAETSEVVPVGKQPVEEKGDVNKQVVSSLLAKLCEKETYCDNPFIQALERVTINDAK